MRLQKHNLKYDFVSKQGKEIQDAGNTRELGREQNKGRNSMIRGNSLRLVLLHSINRHCLFVEKA